MLREQQKSPTVSIDQPSQKTREFRFAPNAAEEPPSGTVPELAKKSNQRYKFIRSIGFGGMKAVLLVLDTDTGREVAMAMMPDFRERPAGDLTRFVREARMTARLEHPNIVPVHDIGMDLSGAPFFTMKYLRGRSLATFLRQVRRNEPEAVQEYTVERAMQIYTRVCNATVFAHSQRILHLDIKPDNVNLGNYGEVLLLDWGLATAMPDPAENGDDVAPPGRTTAKGTPGFMAPEQATGESARFDERTDVYALGALLYTMLTLQCPLAGKSVDEMLQLTMRGEIPPPSEVAPGRSIPAALEAICRKAMQLNPENRYPNAAELRADIQAFNAGFATEAEHASPLRKTALFINRNLLETIMAVIIAMLGAAVLYLLGAIGDKP